jgi:hypothetical protein
LAIPPDLTGNADNSFSDADRANVIPYVSQILKTLELMKRVSSGVPIDNEIESLELPNGEHVETFLTLVNENMGYAFKDWYQSIRAFLMASD